jgi:glycosyltransferase involved in cell wall biosynthesis
MKILPPTESSVAKEASMVPSSITVCMHILSSAQVDHRVMRSATALVEEGFAVSIIDIETERGRPVEEDIYGVRMKHIVTPTWYISKRFKLWFLMQAAWMFIRSTIQLIRTQADIYHAHDISALPACYLATWLRGKLLIFDAHELPLSDELYSPRWRGLIVLFTHLLAIMVPRCAGVITISPPIAQEIRKRYPSSKVTLVRNTPIYQAVQRTDRLHQYLGLSPDVRIALYQGTLQADRELDRLIRAAHFLERNIVIVLMGPDVEGIQPQLETLIENERVADRVKIVPNVPYAEVLDWTASADIGMIIYPLNRTLNIRMCLPNKIFEYLMAGLPILASPLDAVSNLIRTYDVGQIVPSLLPADIGAAINAMMADSLTCARMRRNALNAAQQELCWEKESQRLIHFYHEILARQDVEDIDQSPPKYVGEKYSTLSE